MKNQEAVDSGLVCDVPGRKQGTRMKPLKMVLLSNTQLTHLKENSNGKWRRHHHQRQFSGH